LPGRSTCIVGEDTVQQIWKNKKVQMAIPKPKTRHIYILLDTSKSMETIENTESQTQLEIARIHLNAFSKKVGESPSVRSQILFSVATFSNEFKVLINAESATPKGFQIGQRNAGGATHFGRALSETVDLITEHYSKGSSDTLRHPIIMLLTDGQPKGESENVLNESQEKVKSLRGVLSPHVFVFALPPMNAEALDRFVLGAGRCWDNRDDMSLDEYWNLVENVMFQVTNSSTSDKEINRQMVDEIHARMKGKIGRHTSLYTKPELLISEESPSVSLSGTCEICGDEPRECENH
jgi:uncharacterized protein YegL